MEDNVDKRIFIFSIELIDLQILRIDINSHNRTLALRLPQESIQLGTQQLFGTLHIRSLLHTQAQLTDILILVVRYFGGIKLGTSGLIVAYKAAAAEAISNATIIEKTVDDDVTVVFEYPFMNDIMRIVKEDEPEILEQSYDMDCLMKLRIRRSMMPKLRARLEKVETARILDNE